MISRPPRQPLVEQGQCELHVTDHTATFAVDLTLSQVQERLAPHRQWLPIDGGQDETLEALIDRNSTGPLRLGYGAWRDLLLGVQFRNGRGELITAGGRVVKNVAGYDLTRFMAGQQGVFGKLVTVTTRTYRTPEAALVARLSPDVQPLNRLMTSACKPQWAILVQDDLMCGYVADERTIQLIESALATVQPRRIERHSHEQDIQLRARLWSHKPGQARFRAAVPPSRIRPFVDSARLADWVADPAFGIVLCGSTFDRFDSVRAAALDCGGTCAGVDESGRPIAFGTDPVTRRLLEQLKRAFDPDGQLAPLPLK